MQIREHYEGAKRGRALGGGNLESRKEASGVRARAEGLEEVDSQSCPLFILIFSFYNSSGHEQGGVCGGEEI